MGENEQGGMLRNVVILGLIALISAVVIGLVVNLTHNTKDRTNQAAEDIELAGVDDEATSVFKYTMHDDTKTASIYGLAKKDEIKATDLEIPAKVRRGKTIYKVTEIGSSVFNGVPLKSVVFDGNVETIGSYAFANTGIKTVTLSNDMKIISDGAFMNDQINTITLPGKLDSIGKYAFQNNDLTTIVIKDGIESIGDAAFSHNDLVNLDLPDSVKTVGKWSFSENKLTPETVIIGKSTVYDHTVDSASFGLIWDGKAGANKVFEPKTR